MPTTWSEIARNIGRPVTSAGTLHGAYGAYGASPEVGLCADSGGLRLARFCGETPPPVG